MLRLRFSIVVQSRWRLAEDDGERIFRLRIVFVVIDVQHLAKVGSRKF